MGTPSGITDASSARSGTNRAGNSWSDMAADGAKSFSVPKLTKWLRNEVSFPDASRPAANAW